MFDQARAALADYADRLRAASAELSSTMTFEQAGCAHVERLWYEPPTAIVRATA